MLVGKWREYAVGRGQRAKQARCRLAHYFNGTEADDKWN